MIYFLEMKDISSGLSNQQVTNEIARLKVDVITFLTKLLEHNYVRKDFPLWGWNCKDDKWGGDQWGKERCNQVWQWVEEKETRLHGYVSLVETVDLLSI